METNINFCSLEHLYLDPNNYRFIDDADYHLVDETRIMDERVQQNVRQMILGKSRDNVMDLLNSFRTNGYVNLETVQVRPLDADNYMVIEGNRRVATLKYLFDLYQTGADIGAMNDFDFSKVPINIISDSVRSQMVAMGISHISGKKRWNPYNQAQMIYDLQNKYNMSVEEIRLSLGATKNLVNRCLRTLALIRSYQNSDYGDQFRSDMYSFFEEVVKSPAIKDWLGWDNEFMRCINQRNEERLFSWFSLTDETEVNDDGELVPKTLSPIITKSVEIRDLAKFITDEKALRRMEETRSVNDGFAVSDAIGRSRIESAIDTINAEMKAMLNYAEYLKDDDLDKMTKVLRRFQNARIDNPSFTVNGSSLILFKNNERHFDSLLIKKYRGIENLEVSHLGKINLFVGFNNSGKTMLLEAIYLLTQMNNLRRCLDLEKFRSKLSEAMPSKWLVDSMTETIDIEGVFNGQHCLSHYEKMQEESMDLDKQGYLSTLTNESMIAGSQYESKLQLYEDMDDKHYYNKIVSLCPSMFTSPYHTNHGRLVAAHSRVVELGRMESLIGFMRDHIDNRLIGIRLVDSEEPVRFIVNTMDSEEGFDLTKYGEGMQRIFEISLYILSCAGGCVFIDELDSGIHTTLLNRYVKYLTDLAMKFNVQLFITTHSKECIDTFIENDATPITAFKLQRDDNLNITLRNIKGEELKRLIDNFDIDIRL